MESLRSQLKELGHVYTIERENLLHTIYSMEGTYSISELFQEAQKQNAIHAKSTLFRNMEMLLKSGFIKELESHGKRKIYETNYYSRNGSA
jgi:Fe2+ or Zn2+ uptake regulation protein